MFFQNNNKININENRFDSPIFTVIDKPKEKDCSHLFGKSKSAIFSAEQEWEIKLNNLEEQVNQRLSQVKAETIYENAVQKQIIPKELESIYSNFTILTSFMKSEYINLQLRKTSSLDNRQKIQMEDLDLQTIKKEINELKKSKKKICTLSSKICVPHSIEELFAIHFEKLRIKIENFENAINLLKRFFKQVDPFEVDIDKKSQPRNLRKTFYY